MFHVEHRLSREMTVGDAPRAQRYNNNVDYTLNASRLARPVVQ